MGWSSLIEDNEKLRDHWASICSTITSLKSWAKDSKSADPRHAQFRADDLSRQIRKLAADFEKMLEGLHAEAVRTLSDPNVRIFEHSRKKEAQLAATRSTLGSTKAQIEQRNQAFEKLQKRYVDLERSYQNLEAGNEKLKTDILRLRSEREDAESWNAETMGVKRKKK